MEYWEKKQTSNIRKNKARHSEVFIIFYREGTCPYTKTGPGEYTMPIK
jgi:hypothetical protein